MMILSKLPGAKMASSARATTQRGAGSPCSRSRLRVTSRVSSLRSRHGTSWNRRAISSVASPPPTPISSTRADLGPPSRSSKVLTRTEVLRDAPELRIVEVCPRHFCRALRRPGGPATGSGAKPVGCRSQSKDMPSAARASLTSESWPCSESPPSRTIHWPVTYEAPGLHRNLTRLAISSAVPTLRRGLIAS